MKNVFKPVFISLLIISYVIYPLFFNLLGGIFTIAGARSNYINLEVNSETMIYFTAVGSGMIISSILLTISTFLCIRKKKMSALIVELAGISICMISVLFLVNSAAEKGITDSNFRPYSYIYSVRHFPTVIHSVILIIYVKVQG